jgi:hypothetical protein
MISSKNLCTVACKKMKTMNFKTCARSISFHWNVVVKFRKLLVNPMNDNLKFKRF